MAYNINLAETKSKATANRDEVEDEQHTATKPQKPYQISSFEVFPYPSIEPSTCL